MIGTLLFTLIVALLTMMALRPPMPRHSSPFNLQFAFGWLINEQPFLGLWWLLAATMALLIDPRASFLWWLVAGLFAVDALALVWIAIRSRSARPVLSAALRDAFGVDALPGTRRPWLRILFLPFFSWRPDVRRIRNRRYGPSQRGNRLDVYVSRRRHHPAGAPVLIYLHGGAFRIGTKMLGARPLLYRLAAQGWVCISADYRLLRVEYSDQLADARDAVAWARANAAAYGGSTQTVFLAGSSAGAHLAATAALSGTPVTGVIALGGYYGNVADLETTPLQSTSTTSVPPPFLIIHGALDTLVLRDDARAFAHRLRAVSRQPVVYAELPGTQHNFDYFHSLRFHTVTDAVVRFAELAIGARKAGPRKTSP